MGEDLNTPERIGQPITTPPAAMDVIEPEVSESSASEPIVETRTLNPLNPSTDEQTEDEQEIIQQARSVIDELRLGFLIKEVKIGEIPDIHGQSHKRLADGYIQCYPDGAVIVESSYFMPSEQRAHLVRHEVGHIIDPDVNPYLLNFISTSDFVALKQVVKEVKKIYWQNYFLTENRMISGREVKVRWDTAISVGEKFWPLFLSQLSSIETDPATTFVIPKKNLENLLPESSIFRQIASLTKDITSSEYFSAEELGKGLMFLSQQQPAETNSDLFTDEDRQFIEAKAAEAAIESFAEYYDTFFENTGDDTNLKKTDPELYKTWLSLQAILAVAATQNSTPIPQLVY